MELLARMEPEVAATGHGIPMHGTELRRQLAEFVPRFDTLARPKTGRYIRVPATADGSGVTSVPPPVVQPWLLGLAAAGVALGLAALMTTGKKKSRKGKTSKKNKQDAGTYGDTGRAESRTSNSGSYRAWYRDNPAGSQTSGSTSTADAGQHSTSHHQDMGQQAGDHRYSDQQAPRIETQYP
jgi:hypothetical protein